MNDRVIIGLTGAFGSGCSFIAQEFLVNKHNFKRLSLSKALKEKYYEEHNDAFVTRKDLQDFGNKLRSTDKEVLAKAVAEQIENNDTSYVIDSIRNPAEVECFRKKYPEFILMAVFSDYNIRWDRVRDTYGGSQDQFNTDEIKDQGSNEPDFGQKVSECFFEADLIISNNDHINCKTPNQAYSNMNSKIETYVNAFRRPTSSNPNIKESLMAIAYTIGRRSKCIKRRVGAIIVDESHNVLSSGFNGVPKGLDDCKNKYGECYRDTYRDDLRKKLSKILSDHKVDNNKELSDDIVKNIKVLELCRALHAEESSILNLVGTSKQQDLSGCTLYATTYPCNLCANKIVQAGIKNLVYFEPYPVEESKMIFKDAGVNAEPFEGVTFRAFFRAFNYET